MTSTPPVTFTSADCGWSKLKMMRAWPPEVEAATSAFAAGCGASAGAAAGAATGRAVWASTATMET